jgi:DNA-binding transcriptional LysR family regulator
VAVADLDLLRTFLAVYRAGTITQAAHELHLSQPTVSQQMKALEAQVGRQLLRRVASRGVEPTASGNELAQTIAAHVDALDAVLEGATNTGGGVVDTLYLGGPAEFMTVQVVPVLADLVAVGLRVRFFFDVDAPVVERLGTGELDLAVTTGEWHKRGLEGQRLCYEQLELVAAPAWLEELGPIEPGAAGARALHDAPVLAYDEDLPLVADYWQEVFGTRPHTRAAVVANNLRSVLMLAIAGAGITALPSHVCAEAFERGELVRLLELEQPPRNQLYLAWRAGALRRESIAGAHARIAEAARHW